MTSSGKVPGNRVRVTPDGPANGSQSGMPLPEPAAGEHFVHSPVPDRSVVSTERIQHLDRQTLQPAYPGLPVLCVAWHPTLSVVCLPHRLLTQHIPPSTPAFTQP